MTAMKKKSTTDGTTCTMCEAHLKQETTHGQQQTAGTT